MDSNESCRNDYHQSSERMLTESGIEPATSRYVLMTLKENLYEKHFVKRRKWLWLPFSSFPTTFYILSDTNPTMFETNNVRSYFCFKLCLKCCSLDKGYFQRSQQKYRIKKFTHDHTMMTFDALKERAFWKHCGKRRKCWLPAFSSFPTMFSIQWNTTLMFGVTLNLSSANAFNLGKLKILSSGKGIRSIIV